jgi:TRAP-type mannitol/chloroaromatic compound transport system permease small subunit
MKKNWLNAMGFIIFLLNFIFQMIYQILKLYFDWKPSSMQWGCCMISSLGGMVVGSKHINRSQQGYFTKGL